LNSQQQPSIHPSNHQPSSQPPTGKITAIERKWEGMDFENCGKFRPLELSI
jgi:hypothetical protein